jgi:hypothetical protein
VQIEGQQPFTLGRLYFYELVCCCCHIELILETVVPKSVFLWAFFDVSLRDDAVVSLGACCSEKNDVFIEGELFDFVDIVEVILLAFLKVLEESLEIILFLAEIESVG